jgi:ADP-heptose:LPS heptosyltransferase
LKKVLIIRFSSIGDIVLTTPIVRCIRQQIPGSLIHYLTKKAFSGIVSQNPYIDKVFALEDSLGAVIKQLKAEQYDYIVDLHNNLRSFRVRLALNKPGSTFNKLNFEKWLIVNLKIDRLPDKHIVERYFESTAGLGIRNDQQGLDYFINTADEIDTDQLPKPWRSGYIALVIGARHATKRMPVDRLTEVARLVEKPVILLGGPEDQSNGDIIAAAAGPLVLNYCGKTTLGQSASLVRQSHLVITHDTGLMHIAAAFRKKIISIWGNTIPEFGMFPYLPGHTGGFRIFEIKGLSCRPCSKLGFEKCPRGHFKCMKEHSTVEISRSASRLWEGGI